MFQQLLHHLLLIEVGVRLNKISKVFWFSIEQLCQVVDLHNGFQIWHGFGFLVGSKQSLKDTWSWFGCNLLQGTWDGILDALVNLGDPSLLEVGVQVLLLLILELDQWMLTVKVLSLASGTYVHTLTQQTLIFISDYSFRSTKLTYSIPTLTLLNKLFVDILFWNRHY